MSLRSSQKVHKLSAKDCAVYAHRLQHFSCECCTYTDGDLIIIIIIIIIIISATAVECSSLSSLRAANLFVSITRLTLSPPVTAVSRNSCPPKGSRLSFSGGG